MSHLERVPAATGGNYSDAVAVGPAPVRWIHVAGQIAPPPVPADVGAQAEACFARIAELLEAQGASLSDVVAITVYVTDLAHYESFNAVRGRVFGSGRPASAAVQVAGLLGGANIEIAAVAAVAA